jgi:uncharacterized surface protein with fasciclin (FAS1) repeats
VTISQINLARLDELVAMVRFNLDIVTLLSHIDELSTLHNAIIQAELADSLESAQAVTLFAPKNEAFAKLKGGTIISALEDIDRLKNVLTYHVVPQKLVASNLRKEKRVTTMQGGTLKIKGHRWSRRGIKVNDAVVREADIEGTNGVVHVIDTVLMP